MNKLFYGDNLEVLRKYIKDETIDLCYIDPPFNSKRNYNQIYNNIGKEDKAQAQAFVDTWTWDIMAEQGLSEIITNYNGVFTRQSINLIQGLEKVLGKGALLAYLVSMTLRVAEIFRVLKKTGSFYFHCDPTASHYLKIIIDAVFCSQGADFKNEIIWSNESASGFKSQVKSKYVRGHDVIFYYAFNNSTFNQQFQTLAQSTIKRYDKIDDDGRRYKIYFENDGSERKVYLDKSSGRKISDTWTDLPSFQTVNANREWLGYPTQKPESLMSRIINTSSNKGDLILDAYCGCGTTISVAEKLKRKWIGIDITYQSISLILKRLAEHFGPELSDLQLNGVPHDMESAIALANKSDDRTRKEFEKWCVLTYTNNQAVINEKKGGDGGIDGVFFAFDRNDEWLTISREVIISVKSNQSLSPSVIRDLNGTVEREGAAMGVLITLYPMDNLVKESKKYGFYHNNSFNKDYPKILVIDVQQILDGERIDMATPVEILKEAKGKNLDQTIDLGF